MTTESPRFTKYIPDKVTRKAEELAFGYAQYVEAISESIIDTDPPFTIGIFGNWGTGKSSILEALKENLSNHKYRTVFIDAWRYTTADNLKRAFLARVAYAIGKKDFENVLAQIYTQRQEKTVDAKIYSGLNLPQPLATLFKITIDFISLSVILGFFFFLAISFYVLIYAWATNNITPFTWERVFALFESLLFVPFVTALINFVRPYISNEPIVVTRDPIDADEQFMNLFSGIVEGALKDHGFNREKLVIFVDNLDRLGNKKIIEALEALKAYLDNDKCVFVVAIDDSIVKKVISQSEFARTIVKSDKEYSPSDVDPLPVDQISRVDEVQGPDAYFIGEEYLEKFFQHSYRLPMQMITGLQDFGLSAFKRTQTYDEIKGKVDATRLITILIPEEIRSPRKVKRLVNDFITLYDVAKRRESEISNQLSKGSLTGNIYLIAKFSTIQSEYQDFYRELMKSPELLGELTRLLRSRELGDGDKELIESWRNRYKGELLIRYLIRTQQFLPGEDEDPGKFIYLSEDPFAIALGREKTDQLLSILRNGDVAEFEKRAQTQSEDEKVNEIKLACRFIDSRAPGIEKLNWARVISHMIARVSGETEKKEASNTIFPEFLDATPEDITLITADEYLGVMEWVTIGNRSEQSRKLRQILEGDPVSTFPEILNHLKLVEKIYAIPGIESWFSELAKPAMADDGSPNETLNWLLFYGLRIKDDTTALKKLYLGTLLQYLVTLIVRFSSYEEGIEFQENGEKLDIEIDELHTLFEALGTASINEAGSKFWGALGTLYASPDHEDHVLASNWVGGNIQSIPINAARKLVMFQADALRSDLSTGKVSEEEYIEEQLEISIQLIPRADGVKVLEDPQKKSLLGLINQVGSNNFAKQTITYAGEILDLIDGGKEKEFYKSVYETLVNLFSRTAETEEGNVYLQWFTNLKVGLATDQQTKVLEEIEKLITSNDFSQVEIGSDYVSNVTNSYFSQDLLKENVKKWTEKLVIPVSHEILSPRLELLSKLVQKELVSVDECVSEIGKYLPYGANNDQLVTVTDYILKLKKMISSEVGKNLFVQVSKNIGQFASSQAKMLGIVSPWYGESDEVSQDQFSTAVNQLFPQHPSGMLEIYSGIWNKLSVDKNKVSAWWHL